MKSSAYYRKLLHRFFDGAGEISARELKARGLPPFTRQRRGRAVQEQIDFGAGDRGRTKVHSADEGARARQPH